MTLGVGKWTTVLLLIVVGPLAFAVSTAAQPGDVATAAQRPTARWERLSDGPQRVFHTLTYDPVNDYFWLYGGYAEIEDLVGISPALYRLDAADPDAEWERMPFTEPWPSARALHSATYDPVRHRIILHGGLVPGGDPDPGRRMWYLDLADPDNPAWSRQDVAIGAPADFFGHAAVYVPGLDAMVVAGSFDTAGFGETRDNVYALLLGESPPRWVWLSQPGFGDRAAHTLLYDEVGQRLVAYGGVTSYIRTDARQDIVALDLSDGLQGDDRWDLLQTVQPGLERGFMAAGFDARRRQLWVHGGLAGPDYYLDNLSVLDLSVDPPAWTPVSAGGDEPLERFGHAAAWDNARDRMMVQGGSPDGERTLFDTHALVSDGGPLAPTPTATTGPPAPTPTPSAWRYLPLIRRSE